MMTVKWKVETQYAETSVNDDDEAMPSGDADLMPFLVAIIDPLL